MDDLGDREELVLNTIVTEYIQYSEPVGSRNVSKIGPLRMSPATIRNIMGDLEEKGYLVQPHSSAGRVPTDMGYRYYIDHLVAVDMEQEDINGWLRDSLKFSSPNLPLLLQEFSRRLGEITGAVGFVVVSHTDTFSVKHIEFTRLNRNAVLAIMITRAGFVQNVLLNIPQEISDNELIHISNYLNEQLCRMSISGLRSHLESELNRSAGEIKNIISRLLEMEDVMFPQGIFLEGTSNILNFPEFHDAQKIKNLFRALEEKRTISEILEKCMNNKGVQIFVGREIGIKNIEELGLVTTSYEKDENIVGMLGVIGPKRMPYPKMISVVEYSSKVITQMLKNLYGGYSEE
ncbi:MAG: heat-inducible transcriptional repressor HrcA [Deferribacteraceae bacterium]|nr:heat-inducible transcriptional repressor HrcA [Deferribacteraceae bacterium]